MQEVWGSSPHSSTRNYLHENTTNLVVFFVFSSALRGVAQFEEMNAVYRIYFKEGEAPARVTVQALSPLPGIDIEIKVTAVAP